MYASLMQWVYIHNAGLAIVYHVQEFRLLVLVLKVLLQGGFVSCRSCPDTSAGPKWRLESILMVGFAHWWR